MGEIKSTLDLIMEKTRGLKLNSREKEINQKEQIKRDVRTVVLPYVRGETSLDLVLERLREEDLGFALEVLAESVRLEDDNNRALEALRAICARREGAEQTAPVLDDIDRVLEEYRTGADRVSASLGKKLLEDLAGFGIAGSAVRPASRSHPDYTAQVKKLGDDSAPRLKDALDALVKAWEKSRS